LNDDLNTLRHSLRARMQASPLMDPAGFARQLEDAWLALYGRVAG
jgi:predicted O-linked N-acetylglucosamine transferase (SPINDLY family)